MLERPLDAEHVRRQQHEDEREGEEADARDETGDPAAAHARLHATRAHTCSLSARSSSSAAEAATSTTGNEPTSDWCSSICEFRSSSSFWTNACSPTRRSKRSRSSLNAKSGHDAEVDARGLVADQLLRQQLGVERRVVEVADEHHGRPRPVALDHARASASPAEIRVPPRNVAFQGLAIRTCAAGRSARRAAGGASCRRPAAAAARRTAASRRSSSPRVPGGNIS